MKTYSDVVHRLSEDASKEDMEDLTDMTSDFLESIRERIPDVEKFIMKIDLMLNPVFTKETAEYAVSKMENEDGTRGGHWSYEQTSNVLMAKGYDFSPCDWYYVLNMVYSDYYSKEEDDEYYIKLAYSFLADKDAPKGKAKKYFLAMHS